jgi:hypothetical protein
VSQPVAVWRGRLAGLVFVSELLDQLLVRRNPEMPAKQTKNTYQTSFETQKESTVVNSSPDGTTFIVNSNLKSTSDYSSIGFDAQGQSKQHSNVGLTDGGMHYNLNVKDTSTFYGTEGTFRLSNTSNKNHLVTHNNNDFTYPDGSQLSSKFIVSENKTGSNQIYQDSTGLKDHVNTHGPSDDYFLL